MILCLILAFVLGFRVRGGTSFRLLSSLGCNKDSLVAKSRIRERKTEAIATARRRKDVAMVVPTQQESEDYDYLLDCKQGDNKTNNTNANTYNTTSSRRKWIQNTMAASTTALASIGLPRASMAATNENIDVLPSSLREYTKLAPLGPKRNNKNKTNNFQNQKQQKQTDLVSVEEMVRRLSKDLVEGAHGRGGYFLTGDLSTDLFRDDCVFEDPTNRVDSLSQYQTALTLLFDPERSTVELLGNGLSVTNGDGVSTATTITGRLRSRGYLKVAPWKPYVKAYETTIVYTLDPITGLVARQDQEWTKGASEALKETFTPSWNGEAPKSILPKTEREPQAVTNLFGVLNGRRPGEYSEEERTEVDQQIETIVATLQGTHKKQAQEEAPSLVGTWALVYLQPGPEGAGIDRRIPFFPEFDFNDSVQVFSSSSSSSLLSGNNSNSSSNSSAGADRVTNIGQVMGSLADVRVSGNLRELPAESSDTKRRFEANINGGRLCFGALLPSQNMQASAANCPIDLPMIKGKGIFDSLYLGDRLRIGQNINGGGARVVQVRLY